MLLLGCGLHAILSSNHTHCLQADIFIGGVNHFESNSNEWKNFILHSKGLIVMNEWAVFSTVE